MEKTIEVDGKKILLKSNGATPLRYKMQFKRDFFKDLLKMKDIETDISCIDLEMFYNIIWLLAKTADDTIPQPIEWLENFDTFPIIEIIPQIQDMLAAMLKTINTKK